MILEAARELFVNEGYEGVTMRKVAEKIEYSPTAIYLHFVDKEQLFRELCQQDFASLAQGFQKIAAIPDPLERLRRTGRAYAAFAMEFPNHYKLMFMTKPPKAELSEAQCEVKGNPERDSYAFLCKCVREAIDAGYFRSDIQDPELVAQTFWAALHGVMSLYILREQDNWVQWRPIEDRIELMLEMTLRGF
jgi:AcrR family transcriptional regulator